MRRKFVALAVATLAPVVGMLGYNENAMRSPRNDEVGAQRLHSLPISARLARGWIDWKGGSPDKPRRPRSLKGLRTYLQDSCSCFVIVEGSVLGVAPAVARAQFPLSDPLPLASAPGVAALSPPDELPDMPFWVVPFWLAPFWLLPVAPPLVPEPEVVPPPLVPPEPLVPPDDCAIAAVASPIDKAEIMMILDSIGFSTCFLTLANRGTCPMFPYVA